MPISYVYSGEPMDGTANDDFMIGYKGSTGVDDNTINGNGGDDLVIGDSSDTWIPGSSYLNGSIASAFNLEVSTTTWTTAENEMFGDWTIPHSTVMCETTIGQSEYFRIQIGAGQQITIDLDFASSVLLGNPSDLVVELQDSLGNVIATADDSLVTDGGRGSFPNTPGSASSYDPYLTFSVISAGVYYINVRPSGSDPGATFTDNNTFVMNISVAGHAVTATNPVQGADTINGGDGDDYLFGQGGGDVINGGIGNDFIDGGSGGDIIHGNEGNDTVYGGDGTEENAHGDGGDDTLYSGGEGHYYGDAGNDTVYAGLTAGVNEVLDGGADIDTLDTTTWNGTYIVNLITGVTNFGESFINFENIVTGNGADTITGTAGANVITTHGGADTLDGGAGADTMIGGEGDDTYIVDNTSDVATEVLNQGTDLVMASATFALNANVENLTLTGVAAINGFGNILNNVIIGNAAANQLNGFDGNDTLDGAAGADNMFGGNGDDTYIVDNAGDQTTEASALGGVDTVFASVSRNLTANIENLTLTGVAAITGSGNVLNNIITGNAAANTLYGFDGNDRLDGAGGADTLFGANGNDVYVVDDANDITVEGSPSGGIDTVESSVNRNLNANFENLTLTGTAQLGYGNVLNNVITGNAAVNGLYGFDGNDTLDGGAGADNMFGANGDDTYIVDNAGDVTSEISALGGIDTVISSVTRNLTANLENLTLSGGAAITGAGNALNNVLIGNSAANTLYGLDGADTLNGGLGADTLQGGNGADTYVFSSGLGGGNVDAVVGFSVVDDTIRLDHAIFAGLVDGVLAASAFHVGASAGDADDHIIYNSTTGALYWDADGIGGAAQIQFATLAAGLALTNADFIVGGS